MVAQLMVLAISRLFAPQRKAKRITHLPHIRRRHPLRKMIVGHNTTRDHKAI